jgi:hypothetical protein
MSTARHASEAIREVWEKEAKQRWNSQTHGRGLGLLIVDVPAVQSALMPIRANWPSGTFEFWRDQNKIRGRLIGDVLGNGIVVARLDENGLPIAE